MSNTEYNGLTEVLETTRQGEARGTVRHQMEYPGGIYAGFFALRSIDKVFYFQEECNSYNKTSIPGLLYVIEEKT